MWRTTKIYSKLEPVIKYLFSVKIFNKKGRPADLRVEPQNEFRFSQEEIHRHTFQSNSKSKKCQNNKILTSSDRLFDAKGN